MQEVSDIYILAGFFRSFVMGFFVLVIGYFMFRSPTVGRKMRLWAFIFITIIALANFFFAYLWLTERILH